MGIITKLSGYSSGSWGLSSDHRLLWVDLSIEDLFGGFSAPLWKPRIRRLKLEDPYIVAKFNQLRLKHLNTTNAASIIQQIEEDLTTIKSNGWKSKLEELDKIRTEGILWADHRCRKLRCGNVPWSPALSLCMHTIGYIQSCRLKYIMLRNINSRTLLKLYKRTNLPTPILDANTANVLLKQWYTQLNLLKANSSKNRSNFLQELAERQAQAGDLIKEKVYKQLLLREEQRNTARAMKRALKKYTGGVTAVESLSADGEWDIKTEKEEIEKACMHSNIQKFTQANHLPIMQQDQVELIGWYADTAVSSKILNGTLSTEDIHLLHPTLHDILPFFKMPDSIKSLPPIRCSITSEQYIQEWKKGREFTATGCSGIHFGHFKASCSDNNLMELDRRMAEISLQTGYSLSRWKWGIDVMIPKKSNSLRVDQLRTIVLLEADFNYLNKIIGKRIMTNAELAGSIAEEQFGSRKQKSSISHAINKQLTLDIMRQYKKSFALVVLDDKGCYDRIAPPVAALAMKRQGAPDSFVKMMLQPIREMKHVIRTSYGDSVQFYQQELEYFHGILQGNGSGPTIWAVVSSPLLDKLKADGFGVNVTTTSQCNKQIPAFAFVDDVDLAQELNGSISIVQDAVDSWETSLKSTGGLLVADKCKFFVVKYKWINDVWKLSTELDAREIFISDDSNNRHKIKQLLPTDSEKALGIAFSPSGNMEAEVQYLKQKANEWADKIQTGHLTHKEAWYCLKATVLRSIEYALPATTMTYKQTESIISPILRVGLPRAGICRNISRQIVFTPIKYQGFGIRHPFIGQGIAKLRVVFNVSQTLTQLLINVSWKQTRLESGYGANFLLKHYLWIQPVLTSGWMTSLWEFLSMYGIQLKRVDSIQGNDLRHTRDAYLMEMLSLENEKLPKADKVIFNNCRLYLHVELLSDILTADGQAVRQHMWNGQQQMQTQGDWPNIPRPSETAWKLWRSILRKLFHTNEQGKCNISFPSIGTTTNWLWFLNRNYQRVYEKYEGQWMQYSVVSGRRNTRNQKYGNRIEVSSPIEPLLPVTVYSRGDGTIHIDGIGISESTSGSVPTTWFNYADIKEEGDINLLKAALCQGETILIVSDGSVKENVAGASWILSTEQLWNTGIYICGMCKVPGTDLDSHRAECFGLFGAIQTIHQYYSEWDVTQGELLFACDNISALEYMFCKRKNQHINASTPDYDIICATRKLLQELNVVYTWKHVKGHQQGSNIDVLGHLNIMADTQAGVARKDTNYAQPPDNIPLYQEQWQLSIPDGKVTKNLEESIHDYCMQESIQDVWHRYKRVDTDSFYKVDWNSIKQAMQESTISARHWITKRAARDCGSNYVLFRRKQRSDDFCIFCGASETVLHVCRCQSSIQLATWNNALHDFKKWLVDNKTAPNIVQSLMEGLQKWYEDAAWDGRNNENSLIQLQASIGWDSVLEGCFGQHWSQLQDSFYKLNNSRRTGHRWMTMVIRRIWKIPWAMWERRNLEVHAHDKANELKELQALFRTELEIGSQQIPELRIWFKEDQIVKLQNNPDISYLRLWIRNVKAGRKRDMLRRGSDRELEQMQGIMRRFLGVQ